MSARWTDGRRGAARTDGRTAEGHKKLGSVGWGWDGELLRVGRELQGERGMVGGPARVCGWILLRGWTKDALNLAKSGCKVAVPVDSR